MKIKPTTTESPFFFDELFFSTTNRKGVIQFANDVFLRVSKYKKDEVIGAPHNIIRHPDMPRAVFKIFWDSLKAEQPIGAYVKNIAKDGSFYWVYALAFPVEDGYLSIRFKPSSPLFKKIQEIYHSVLELEKKESMDSSVPYLLSLLEEEGFSNYNDFMTFASTHELEAREQQFNTSRMEHEDDKATKDISDITNFTSAVLDKNFTKISNFQKSNRIFSESIQLLKKEFQNLRFLSVNINVRASHFGEKAVTLNVVASEFTKTSDDIEKQLNSFSGLIDKITNAISKCSLHLASLKTQMIMVDFFVKESITKLKITEDAFSDMIDNQSSFSSLFIRTTEKLIHEITELKASLTSIDSSIKDIQKFIIGLEVIKQTGSIESSRVDELHSSFQHHLQEMGTFIVLLKKTTNSFSDERRRLLEDAEDIKKATSRVAGNLTSIFEEAFKMSRHTLKKIKCA